MLGLIRLCVRYRGTVAILTMLSLVLGGWSATKTPLDVFPEFVPSSVDIQTEAPGFAAEQVEQLVTRPIEDAISGAPGVSTMRSESIPGLSVITVTFQDGVNVYNARQGISEFLSELGNNLPTGTGPPKLSPLVSSTMDLLKIGLVSETLDPYALRDFAEWVLKPALLAVPGVAHVILFGGAIRQIQIQTDVDRLAAYGITLTDVADTARAALALRGAGYIDLTAQRVLLQSPTPGPDTDRLASAVLAVRNGTPILLRDIAVIKEAPAQRSGDSLIMGQPGVLLSLASQYGANTLRVTQAVEAALADVRPALTAEGIKVFPALHRPANFIQRALGNLGHAIVIAALLILAVLYVFLRDWRSALITFLAIPLSLLAAIATLNFFGYTLNTMTLGGFAVSLGVLVDDAIIGIENILRRLRENTALETPSPRLDVIATAAFEVRSSVIYATLVAIVVFLPELFSTSIQGRFVGPMATAFILAVLASLVVAMTVTPALCALCLSVKDTNWESPRWISRAKSWQAFAIEAVQARLGTFVVLLTALFAGALALLPLLGATLMPDFREGHFVMQVSSSIPGTSFDEMLAIGRRVSSEVLNLPYVQTVEQQIGRAELSEDTWGPHRSEFHVELKPDATIDQTAAEEALRQILENYAGIQTEVVTFLGDRISESLSGETAQVAIKVFGDNLDQLDRVGLQIQNALSDEQGIVDLQFNRQTGTPTFSIALDADALAANGVKADTVLDVIEADYAGVKVGQTYSGTRSIDVVVLLDDTLRHRLDYLPNILIAGPFGPVPLSQLGRITPTSSRYSIEHDGGQRRISVTFNVKGRSLQEAVAEAQNRISSIKLPAGTYVEFAGAAEEERRARTEMAFYSVLALVLIVMLLFLCFRWRVHPWLVMANLPFSLIGGIFAIAISGVGLTLGAIVGLITVFGISARNAILLLAHYEHLVENEGAPWNAATITRGAQERLVPILMTALVTALALMPLAFGINQAGQEIEGPMAITVLGALLSSTLLNLALLPALALRYSRPSTPQGGRHK